MRKIINTYGFPSAIITLAFVYLFFPSNNLSMDPLNYGCEVKYGETLFEPHHLLYSYFNYLLYNFCNTISPFHIDVLKFMQCLNGIFAILCLFLFNRLLQKFMNDKPKANAWTLFAGCCFGVMRYAVDAETYIIPIFFSLLSSWYYLNYLTTAQSKNVWFAGVFASLACLFHQIHLFWGIGLFLGFLRTRKIKNVFYFSIPAFSVLAVYSIVLIFYDKISFSFNHLIRLLFHYYYSDSADVHLGSVNFIMTPISFFRTFFQVHGVISDILRLIPFFYILFLPVLFFIALSVYYFKKEVKFKKEKLWSNDFQSIHLLIFALQLGFAFFSHGNAKFMVMLPFLIPFFIYLFLDFKLKPIVYLSLAMLIWNFCFAIFPDHYFDYQNNKELIAFIKENPDKVFVLKESNNVACQYYYETGVSADDRIVSNIKIDTIRNFFNENKIIYTDVLTKKVPFNRADIALSSPQMDFVFVRRIKPIDTILGGFYIDEVVPK